MCMFAKKKLNSKTNSKFDPSATQPPSPPPQLCPMDFPFLPQIRYFSFPRSSYAAAQFPSHIFQVFWPQTLANLWILCSTKCCIAVPKLSYVRLARHLSQRFERIHGITRGNFSTIARKIFFFLQNNIRKISIIGA